MSQSQPINICLGCSNPMVHLEKFDIYLCYTCSANAEKEMHDAQFKEINSQPIKQSRCICISEDEDEASALTFPKIKRSTAIDNCKDDPVILKKNEDLYVSYDIDSHEIRSSITFEVVPNYRYNEITKSIEKIDPTIEEEDRRLIVLQRNPKAILFEDYERNI
jgi:hypothetical protein